MDLGAFSLSLAVAELDASREFYARLGFEAFGGEAEQGWLMMRNGSAVIGLFAGMFERNILTFNPGWDESGQAVDPFSDVRDIQRRLRESGVELHETVDEESSGPGSIVVVDPDGNPILIDQHR